MIKQVIFVLIFFSIGWFLGSDDLNTQNNLINTFVGDPNVHYAETSEYTNIGADGHNIRLLDNPNATNPTWAELKAFIKADDTDKIIYNSENYVCADSAEDLHNNAEKAGIIAYWVGIEFEHNWDGHALNCFDTTDRGRIYIDCTGEEIDADRPSYYHSDAISEVTVGSYYTSDYLYPMGNYYRDNDGWKTEGRITAVEIF